MNGSTPAVSLGQAHFPQRHDRRQFLLKAGGGIGGLALAGLMQQEARAAWPGATDPLAPRQPHFAPRAKRVIWLFMHGGPSHMDLFDPKPDSADWDPKAKGVLKGQGQKKYFADMVAYTDKMVGRFVAKFEQLGLRDNTRVPFIANWPGTIPAGKVSRDLADFSDFLPTVFDPLEVKPLDTGRLGNAQCKTLAMQQNVLDEKEGTRTRFDLKKYKTKK